MTISVDLQPTYRTNAWEPPFNDVIAALYTQRSRWRSIRFCLPAFAFNFLDLSEEENPPSNLKQLYFQLYNQFSGPIPLSFKEFFSHLPGLLDFTMKTLERGAFPLLENLPWAQLTNLHLECVMSPEDYRSIFRRSPMLQACHLENVARALLLSSIPSKIQPPIIRAHLQYLHITGEPRILYLFDSVTLPSLQKLVIGIVKPSLIRSLTPLSTFESLKFQRFIERSNPSLQVLKFDNVLLQESVLVEILVLLPTLQSLAVNDDSHRLIAQLSDELLLALEGRQGDAFICPRLTTIRLTGQLNASDGRFSQMVSERWGDNAVANQVTPLKVVQVELSRKNGQDIDYLMSLRSHGLKVILSF